MGKKVIFICPIKNLEELFSSKRLQQKFVCCRPCMPFLSLKELGTSSSECPTECPKSKNTRQQHSLAAKVDDSVQGCLRRSSASRLRDVILPFYSALVRPHQEHCSQSCVPQYERDMDGLEESKIGLQRSRKN